MDFKFLEFLKEIIDDALYASIAKLAIAFYLGKKFIEFLISGFNIAYKEKERRKEYIDLKKDVADFKIEQKKTNEKLEAFGTDLNAYKKRTHKIESESIAQIKIIEKSNNVIEKNNDLIQKLNNKL